jgi:hypothetical protein
LHHARLPARGRRAGRAFRVRRSSAASLAFLRGRDADARLIALRAHAVRSRPLLGALAAALLETRAHETLGFRSLGDWAQERLGVGARVVREWARVWRGLAALPRLREAVVADEVPWTAARLVVGLAAPASDEACLAAIRGRTTRAVEALVAAVRAAEARGPTPEEAASGERERGGVRVACSAEVATKWVAACELARRVAGDELPTWACAEAIAAECASAVGAPPSAGAAPAPSPAPRPPVAGTAAAFRAAAWPGLPWPSRARPGLAERLERAAAGLRTSPAALDRALRSVVAWLQASDLETGRILRQVVDRRLARELGFESFETYCRERLDLAPRTARRLVRLARAERSKPEVASAFRDGRITGMQAERLLRGGSLALAEAVTLRRLRDEVPEAEVAFSAPPEVAALFCGLVARVGLERMLDHAIATWLAAGSRFRDYADFARDGWRCTAPACSARRGLESHHVVFRSAGGPDEPWNRTTLCAFHHHRGVHAGRVRIRGRAPGALVYELGFGRLRSGDEFVTAADPRRPAASRR